ncbi:MAG: energy-coupling factor transporter transmembrane protein EcfT [Acidobacteria bacterium]|nr:energy-coupling factor transporter transmembrane protein EcfT [Acidobacteriota bacterium]
MRHSFIDRYALLDSPLHILEPRSKLLAFTALIVCVLSIPAGQSPLFVAYFFATAILMGISQIPLPFIVGRTLLILPFIVLAGIAVPWRGFSGLTTLLVRAALCLILLILLTNTTRFVELLRGLRKLGCPQILVMNLSSLYRYFFVLTEEVVRMMQARACRRVGRAPIFEELKILRSMLGTLLIRSFERAKRTHGAMLSRGYAGEFPVVSPRGFTWRDLAFLSIVTAFIAVTFLLR